MTTTPVDLASILEDKFEAWERRRAQGAGEDQVPSADVVLRNLLSRAAGSHVYFVEGTGPMGSIQSFRAAYDNERAWSCYETELEAELTDDGLATIPFDVLVNGLAR